MFRWVLVLQTLWRHPKFRTDVNEPRHDKTNNVTVRPAKTQISLGIRPVWSASSLSAWRNLGSLATHWAHSEDSDQTGRMPRLIWVFAGRTLILLVLSCRGSNAFPMYENRTTKPYKFEQGRNHHPRASTGGHKIRTTVHKSSPWVPMLMHT